MTIYFRLMIIEKIISAIFPSRCPFCRKVIREEEFCCEDCKKKFPNRVIKSLAKWNFTCISSFPYCENFRKAVLTLKKQKTLGIPLGKILAESITEGYADFHFDIITAVPLYKSKFKKRGYNQAEILAREVSKKISVPYIEVLDKIKNTKDQHLLKGRARIFNVLNAYRAKDKDIIANKNILIIDDIITTGCTLGECARVIRKAGANKVYCATVCRA